MASRPPTPPRRRRIRRAPTRPRKDLSMKTINRTLAALLLLAGLAAAQTPSAILVGRIVDPTNAAVAGAAIRVRNVDTNVVRTAETQLEGEYTVAALTPG